MGHNDLVRAAIKACERVHADTSVPIEETVSGLKQVRDELAMLIDAAEMSI